MRIIFLDVDGVLNYVLTKDRYHGMMGLDEQFICNLSSLIEMSSVKGDTKVVLTSSWRAGVDMDGKMIPDHLRYLDRRLQEKGIEIYDETPIIRYSQDENYSHRGKEIMTWLYHHRDEDITGMVILDDVIFQDYLSYKLIGFLVKSRYLSKHGGLNEALVDKALKILDVRVDVESLLKERNFEVD